MTTKQKHHLEACYKRLYVEGWDELLVKLKAHGGEMLDPMPEPAERVQLLLSGGRAFDRTRFTLRLCEEGNSHMNAGRIWAENSNFLLVTGYALTKALWKQHSWVWDPSPGEYIETTQAHEKYFGVVLNDGQAIDFTLANVPEYEFPKHIPRPMAERAHHHHLRSLVDLIVPKQARGWRSNQGRGSGRI